MAFNRRDAIVGGVATASLLGFEAEAQTLKTRYSATSTQGKAMLVKYANAVRIMRTKFPVSDPRNWNFQWYSHWIPGPQDWAGAEARKKQVLDATFGTSPSPGRTLAETMWNGCQAHGRNPGNPSQYQETFFLPWHRWFVYYFEQIIRGVLQDDSFTLPYWDYLLGTVPALSIPPEFYKDTSSPLYQGNRNPWVNQGQRIDLQNPGALNLNAFNYAYYINGSTGFCPTLDGNPHGAVHDLTGGPQNMGYVPTAGGDPIFWLHHCNIDRLWATWNLLGHQNPSWDTTRKFTFANGQGQPVQVLLNGATNIKALGYQYDTYQKVPAKKTLTTKAPRFAAGPTRLAALAAPEEHGVTLSATAPTRLQLTGSAPNPRGGLMAAAPTKQSQVFLALTGVTADESFGGTYNVYVGLPAGATPGGTNSLNYVGTFGSFTLMGHDHGDAGEPNLVFDITDKAAALAAKGQLPASPEITFVPMGQISKPPSVESVSIVTN